MINNKFETQRNVLLQAQELALNLVSKANEGGLFRGGITEKALNTELYKLAEEQLGIKKYWHKRIVRAGENTLHPYRENPEDLMIQADDILFLDLGPIVDAWEADIGRTLVLGEDPVKRRLQHHSESLFAEAKAYFNETWKLIRACDLYNWIKAEAAILGYELGGWHCGHHIGEFPHEELKGDGEEMYIHAGNELPLMQTNPEGNLPHWILEIHLIDRQLNRGAFYEQLLTDEIK